MSRRWEHAALAGVVLVATALIAHFGLRNHTGQFDEFLAVVNGRQVQDDLTSIWQWDLVGRGPERLGAILMAFVYLLVPGGTPTELVAGHLLWALLAALAAVPAFALARGCGAPKVAALLAGALAVLTPWAVFGATYLNTAPGVLTSALLLWAMWHATLQPGWRGDLLVLGAFLLTTTARVGHTPLVLAMAPAVLLALWHGRPAGERVGRWLRAAPRRLATDHPLLLACAVGGLLLLAVKGQAGVLGAYGSGIGSQDVELDRLWLQIRTIGARTAEAFAVVPFLIAVPWIVREAVRPRSREAGTFAVLAAGVFCVLLYVVYSGQVEDRYIAPLAVPVAVGFAVAVGLRQVELLGVLLTGVVVAIAIHEVGAAPDASPYSYFVAPSAQFFQRALVQRASADLPLGGDPLAVALVVAVGLALLVVLLLRRRPALATGVLAAALALTTVGAVYAAQKWTSQATYPERTFDGLAFVDEAIGDTPAAYYANLTIEDEDLRQRLLQVHFANRSFRGTLVPAGRDTNFYCCPPHPLVPARLEIDRRTGAIDVLEGDVPPYVVVPTGWTPTGLAARRVAQGEPSMAVERLRDGPPRLAFAFSGGVQDDGWARPGRTTQVRLFPGAAGARGERCVGMVVTAPPTVDAPEVRYSARTGAARETGTLAPGAGKIVRLRVRDAATDDLAVRGTPSGTLADGRPAGLLVSDVWVSPCDEPRPGA